MIRPAVESAVPAENAPRFPQPLGKPSGFPTAPTAATTTGYSWCPPKRGRSAPIPSSACALDPRQEPSAGKLHAGICAGGGPKGPSLPRHGWEFTLEAMWTIDVVEVDPDDDLVRCLRHLCHAVPEIVAYQVSDDITPGPALGGRRNARRGSSTHQRLAAYNPVE